MLKLYGTDLCPDCIGGKEHLDSLGIAYEYRNITEDIYALKEFLLLRDTREEFQEFLGKGYIMVPTCLTDEGKILFYEEIMKLGK